MPSGSQYGAVDSPPVPPAQATQATTQRLSSYSTKSKPSGPESVLPVVAPSSHSNNNALSNGNGNGHSNGLNGANGNGVGNGAGGSQGGKGPGERMKVWLSRSIDSKQASLISVANCFLTGFTSAVAFSACYIWYVPPIIPIYYQREAKNTCPSHRRSTQGHERTAEDFKDHSHGSVLDLHWRIPGGRLMGGTGGMGGMGVVGVVLDSALSGAQLSGGALHGSSAIVAARA